jgi:drug/metabolite transporter (DMT)-like permease
MAPRHFFQLLLLAAIWGSSFMFMRIAVPALGPNWMLAIRLASATLFLFVVTRFIRQALQPRRYWRHYLILGIFNTALPFYAFSWSAQVLPASMLAIMNSTAPLWGLIVGVIWRGKPITLRAALGLCFGMGGVALLVGLGGAALPAGALIAVPVALTASICYGIASSYAEFAESVPPFANAHGSLWAACLLLLPFMPFAPLPATWPTEALLAALTLGIVCSGVAYLLFYHLISTIGAPGSMTVGYLIPLWGVFWGWLFLDERIGWNTLAGAACVLTGTALVTGFRLRSILGSRRPVPASGEA